MGSIEGKGPVPINCSDRVTETYDVITYTKAGRLDASPFRSVSFSESSRRILHGGQRFSTPLTLAGNALMSHVDWLFTSSFFYLAVRLDLSLR